MLVNSLQIRLCVHFLALIQNVRRTFLWFRTPLRHCWRLRQKVEYGRETGRFQANAECLRLIIDIARAHRQTLFSVCFVDFEKAFDRVSCKKLWRVWQVWAWHFTPTRGLMLELYAWQENTTTAWFAALCRYFLSILTEWQCEWQ